MMCKASLQYTWMEVAMEDLRTLGQSQTLNPRP